MISDLGLAIIYHQFFLCSVGIPLQSQGPRKLRLATGPNLCFSTAELSLARYLRHPLSLPQATIWQISKISAGQLNAAETRCPLSRS